MKKYVLVIMSVFAFFGQSMAQDKLILSETALKKMIENSPPSIQQIEASFLSIKSQQMSKLDQYSFSLDGSGSVYSSKEPQLSSNDGITQSSSSYSLGVHKATPFGVTVGVNTFGGKSISAFSNDAATTGVSLSLNVDLFQNFLGRNSHNDIKKSSLSVKRATLEKDNQIKMFKTNTRKLYWALIANNEQKLLLESLVKSANKQYKEALSRRKSGVADAGEVARYRSQWTTRKANLLSLSYQRGNVLKSLRSLLPELDGKNIQLENYSVDVARTTVLACTAKIDSFKKAPMQFSNYDEIINILNKEERLESKIINTYDDPKIQLAGEYSSVGRDFGYSNAMDNFRNDSKGRSSLSLQVSIPLSSQKRDHQKLKQVLTKRRYQSMAQNHLLKVRAYHVETTKIIQVLQQVLLNQNDTNKSLATSLKSSQRKYKQARISVQELISEQDTYLQSRLDEIQTHLTIVNTLMDYFSLYTDFPCEFNKI